MFLWTRQDWRPSTIRLGRTTNYCFLIMPMVGTKGMEPRTGGASGDHQIMFTFANNVSLADASVTPGQNGAGRLAGPPVVNGKRITLNLTGVTNRQVLTVNLTGVSDG